MFISRLLVVGAVLGCAACTAVTSISDPNQEGMVYLLPKTLLTMTVLSRGDGAPLEITEIDPVNTADTTSRYVMRYRHNPFYSDRLCAGVSKEGMLEIVELATDDKTPEMVLQFLRARAPFARAARMGEASGFVQPTTAIVTFDPYLRRDVAIAERTLQTRFADKSIRIRLPETIYLDSYSKSRSQEGANLNGPNTCNGRGLCFRTIVRTPVILESDGKQEAIYYTTIVDRNNTGGINLKRGFFVEKIQRLKFEDGALVGATVRHPSEGLAVANVVTSVIRAFRLRQTAKDIKKIDKEADAGSPFNIECNNII